MTRRFAGLVLCLLAASCGGSESQYKVAIAVKTSLGPGTDFDSVSIEMEGASGPTRSATYSANATDPFGRRVQVAQFANVPRGTAVVVARLEKDGVAIAMRSASLEIKRDALFVVDFDEEMEDGGVETVHDASLDSPSDSSHDAPGDAPPETVDLTFATSPPGLGLVIDAALTGSPTTIESMVGASRMLDAPSTQSLGNNSYVFASWSDSGLRAHAITTPATDTTYTATYAFEGGLLGEYFDDATLTTSVLTRTDPTVNFDWAGLSPDPSIGVNTFSVRWTGFVKPEFSENYTFYTSSDDGVRLWVDNQLIIDDWHTHALKANTSTTIALTANQRYSIKLEYYDNNLGATVQLSWSSTSTAKAIIPQARLSQPGSTE